MAMSPSGSTAAPQRSLRVSLLTKILVSIVLAGALPMIIISVQALNGYSQASQTASDISKQALDQQTTNTLQLQAIEIADRVGNLLNTAVSDTHAVAGLVPTPEAYLAFYQSHFQRYSYAQKNSLGDVFTVSTNAPTYTEIAFIDASGQEQLRIVKGKVVAANELRDVSKPENTTYLTEDYFAKTVALDYGGIWVTPVTAWHTSNPKQTSNTVINDPVGFAFSQYEAVIRFSTPVYAPTGEVEGIVVLSLDHRHIMNQVVHYLSLALDPVPWANYSGADYAFLFDTEGYTIAHPLLSRQRGLDENGNLIEPYTPEMSSEEKSTRPFNLKISSKDPAFAAIYNSVLAGKIGSQTLTNEQKKEIVRAYAPIPFKFGIYAETGIFGGVQAGASLERFNKPANAAGQKIRDQQSALTISLLVIIAIALVLMSVVALFLARGVTNPLRLLTSAAQDMAKGEYDPQKLEKLSRQRVQDEVSLLSGVFKTMAEAVQMREKRLKDQVQTLLIQIDQVKKEQQVKEIVETEYFAELQRNAANLRSRARRNAAARAAGVPASPDKPPQDEGHS